MDNFLIEQEYNSVHDFDYMENDKQFDKYIKEDAESFMYNDVENCSDIMFAASLITSVIVCDIL